MSSPVPSSSTAFDQVYAHLLSLPPPLLPPDKPPDAARRDRIASLSAHPSVEAALHLLNGDLASAHFLCRHMQAAPQHEGMYLHGILHRIEGDYDNARAWYGDVAGSDVFRAAWADDDDDDDGGGGGGGGLRFIDRVEAFRAARAEGCREELEARSLREIRSVLEFCLRKFGAGEVADARSAWKQPEHNQLARDMVLGDKGFRDF